MWFKWSLFVLFLLIAFAEMIESRHPKNSHMTKKRHGHGSKNYNSNNPQRYSGKKVEFWESDRKVRPYVDQTIRDLDGEISSYEYDEGDYEEDDLEEEEAPKEKEEPFLCPSSSCTTDLEMSKLIRIMQIKEQVLKETGLDAPPNMTGVVISDNPQLQSLIHNVNMQTQMVRSKNYDKHDEGAGDDPNVKSEQIFITASKGPDWLVIPKGENIIYFQLGRWHASSIVYAKLHLWLRLNSAAAMAASSKELTARINILKVEPTSPGQLIRLNEVLHDIEVPYNGNGIWAKVDLYSLVRYWLLNPTSNLGFIVQVSTPEGTKLEVGSMEEDPSHVPVLELDISEERNQRRKRYANNRVCSNHKVVKICCRYPMIVNFMDFHFDFIVAPKKYEANYCMGDCPFLLAHKYPHSTLLQQKLNNTNSSIGRCCGARSLVPLKMIYYDGKKIKVGTINDMVVKQCSCT